MTPTPTKWVCTGLEVALLSMGNGVSLAPVLSKKLDQFGGKRVLYDNDESTPEKQSEMDVGRSSNDCLNPGIRWCVGRNADSAIGTLLTLVVSGAVCAPEV